MPLDHRDKENRNDEAWIRRAHPIVTDEMRARVAKILAGTQFINGKEEKTFEKEFARYCGSKYCVAANSGTSALWLALSACKVGPGDEVITTPLTFFSTASTIASLGAKPVFADVDARTLTLDPDAVHKRVTLKTRAIVVVHLYGQAANMLPIMETAERHGLRVIEDATEAVGAKYNGRRVGSNPETLSCFSFYPTKNITCCGDGGAVVTGIEELADRLRLLHNYGLDYNGVPRLLGSNMRLGEISAAILRVQLRHIEEWNRRRREIAAIYGESIETRELIPPYEAPYSYHVYYVYVIRAKIRDKLALYLMSRKIETGIHFYPVLYKVPALKGFVAEGNRCSVAEKAAKEVLTLPMHAALRDEEAMKVGESINMFYSNTA